MNPTLASAANAGSRIHVLQVIGNAIVGGMESWVERLIERLPRDRFEFTALCPFESPYTDRLRALDVEVLVAPMPDDPPWTTMQTATALVATGGIDLLHAHLPKAHLLAGIVGKLTGKPVLTTIHGRQLTTLDLEVHRATGSHLSVVCKQTYFHALGLGVSAGHLSCDTNGVDTQIFQPQPRPAAGIRSELGLPEDTPLVGFVGRLSPEKGPEVFVRAAMLLRTRRPEAHAVLVGEGPMEDELRDLAQRLGAADRLHFLGLRGDMPSVYSQLDLLALCSHSEAMPLALMEAMSCGVAAVATRVGGVPEIVEHGQTGWLVAPGDFDDIAAKCDWLLGDTATRLRMGERARVRAVERLDLTASVERVGALLTRLSRPRGGEAQRRVPQVAPVVSSAGSAFATADGTAAVAAAAGAATARSELPRRGPVARNGTSRPV